MSKINYDPFNLKEEPEAKVEQKEFMRHTFVIRKEHLKKIKEAAYWQRLTQKDLLDKILEEYFKINKPKEIE